MKKWNAKKWICFGALVLNYLPFLCFLFPVYVEKGPPPVYKGFIDYLSGSGAFRISAFIICYALFFLLVTGAAVFFVKALRAPSDTGDAEDKNYVFGFVFLMLGNLILAITMFGQSNYIPMSWSLLYVLAGLGMIVLHFKKLSTV